MSRKKDVENIKDTEITKDIKDEEIDFLHSIDDLEDLRMEAIEEGIARKRLKLPTLIKKKYKIIFSKWINPLQDISEDEQLIENLKDFNDPDNEDSYWKEGDEDEYETIESSPKKMNAVMTPVGIIPMNEYTDISNIFSLWNGFTNFNISELIHDIIEDVDGVEILHIFTPYRFRFAVGKLFKPSEVFNSIQVNVLEYLNISNELDISLIQKEP